MNCTRNYVENLGESGIVTVVCEGVAPSRRLLDLSLRDWTEPGEARHSVVSSVVSGVTVWAESPGVRKTAMRFGRADELDQDVFHFSGRGWREEFRRFVRALDDRHVESCHVTSRCRRGTFQPWRSIPLRQMARQLDSEWFPAILDQGALTSVLQPIWSLRDKRVHGFEALCRARLGSDLVAGGVLVDAAKVHGLLGAFDLAARRAAIVQGSNHLLGEERLFINILPSHVDSPERDFAPTWAALMACEVDPGRVVFEFVESEALPPIEKMAKIVGHIRSRGANVALDDFGAGHASLTMLDELRPDVVKFDRALMPAGPSEPKVCLLRGLVAYAHSMGIETIAEGIETMDQLMVAEDCGFDHVQGWLIGKPSEVPCRPESIGLN